MFWYNLTSVNYKCLLWFALYGGQHFNMNINYSHVHSSLTAACNESLFSSSLRTWQPRCSELSLWRIKIYIGLQLFALSQKPRISKRNQVALRIFGNFRQIYCSSTAVCSAVLVYTTIDRQTNRQTDSALTIIMIKPRRRRPVDKRQDIRSGRGLVLGRPLWPHYRHHRWRRRWRHRLDRSSDTWRRSRTLDLRTLFPLDSL